MKILCVSDAHLFKDTLDREEKLVDLIENEDYDELILLGDIYDFWFEYRSFIPSYAFKLTSTLVKLSAKKSIVYISGNHDAWIGEFWKDVGIEIHRFFFKKNMYDRDFLFTHGDLVFGDKSSRVIRSIFHNPVAVYLFSILHPDLGAKLARSLSSESKKREEGLYMERILESFRGLDCDVLITGHLHVPFIHREGQRLLVCTGEWMERYTYVKIYERRIYLMEFGGGIIGEASL